MTIDDLRQYKLMVLYMLKKAQFRLSNSQIVAFFQEKNYIDYFSTQELLEEMIEYGLISVNESKIKSLYSITEGGIDCIKFFEKDIEYEHKEAINKYLTDNKIKMREESNSIADFIEGPNKTYDVRLETMEGKNKLFSININVPDTETARLICENWKSQSSSIYEQIIKKLLG